jgi:hypothetical protein
MSSKYQREIEEILEKAGDLESSRRSRRAARHSLPRLVWLYVKRSLSGKLWSLSPGRVMLFGLVLLLSTLVVRPFVNGVSGYLAWAGLLISIVGYGMVLVKPPTTGERHWRGQPIDSPGESWWGRFRRRRG